MSKELQMAKGAFLRKGRRAREAGKIQTNQKLIFYNIITILK
jgi:hypothetical protein